MGIEFYLDEDVDISLQQALTNRGVEIMTTQGAGNIGNTDYEQLMFATGENRVIITHNTRDFMILHKNFLMKNNTHSGMVVSDQLPVGTLLKRVMKLWFTLNANDMQNRIEFLSSWR